MTVGTVRCSVEVLAPPGALRQRDGEGWRSIENCRAPPASTAAICRRSAGRRPAPPTAACTAGSPLTDVRRGRARTPRRLLDPVRRSACRTDDFLLLLAGAPILVLAIFAAVAPVPGFRLAPAEEFRRIILAVSASIGVIMLDSFWLQGGPVARLGGHVLGARAVCSRSRRGGCGTRRFGHLREAGVLAFPTLIVGDERRGEHGCCRSCEPGVRVPADRRRRDRATSASTSACPSSGSIDDLRDDPRRLGRGVRLRGGLGRRHRRHEGDREGGAPRRRRGADHGDAARGAREPPHGAAARRPDGAVAAAGAPVRRAGGREVHVRHPRWRAACSSCSRRCSP